jgi:phosphate transport system permease protein
MTDIAPYDRSFLSSGPELAKVAAARVAKRNRAERRFKALGFAALMTAAAFLVVLIGDIIIKAIPAFMRYDVTIPVTASAEKIDASKLAAGDYDGVLRDGLRATFPTLTTRTERKALDSILASSASSSVRQQIANAPSLIGSQFETVALLSSTADLYLKGATTPVARTPGSGSAAPSAATGKVIVKAQPGAFQTELEKAGAENGATELLLDTKKPSLLLFLNGGAVKASRITSDTVEGEAIIPLSSAEPSDRWTKVTLQQPEASRKVTDREAAALEILAARGVVQSRPNWEFFTSGDSREPESAGILGALVGTALTMLVTILLCLPIGVGAAIYLEEFSRKSRLTEMIEVSVNNLAAVPSIVFGLLGLAVFLNAFGMPRSSAIVGGLVLALLVLPTIIIASRAALRAVPPSIREAALGVGASKHQAIFHHVLPLAMPGILTGTIIGMAHALGETAPLLLIGMVAFIADVPSGLTSPATVLPVQIFLWSDLPELGFQARTAAAILVLLTFLVLMNGVAIWLRKRFERRW